MQYREFLRVEKIRKILDVVAYGSLVIDFSIAIVTLVSFNAYSQRLNQIQYLLNIALTIEVLVTSVLLITLALLYHYDKILDRLARMSSSLTGRGKRPRKIR